MSINILGEFLRGVNLSGWGYWKVVAYFDLCE